MQTREVCEPGHSTARRPARHVIPAKAGPLVAGAVLFTGRGRPVGYDRLREGRLGGDMRHGCRVRNDKPIILDLRVKIPI